MSRPRRNSPNLIQGKRLRRLALAVALEQVRGGANVLDVNMDEAMLDSVQAMTAFLNLVASEPDRAPAHHDRQLEFCGHRGGPQVRAGKGIVNSISLKEARTNSWPGRDLSPLRRRRGGDGLRRGWPGRDPRPAGWKSASVPIDCWFEQADFPLKTSSSMPTCLAVGHLA